MRLLFTTSISSSEWGSYGPGEVGEVPNNDEAQKLIAAGFAEPVEPQREKAVKRPNRRASK